MKYWWVNHKQTYRKALAGGYLWSPKTKSGNIRNRFYDSMTEAMPGDVVISFANARIQAIGFVTGVCEEFERPEEFQSAGKQWAQTGWRLPVSFTPVSNKVRPIEKMGELSKLLFQYAPITKEGKGKQAVYLASLTDEFAVAVLDLVGPEAWTILSTSDADPEILQVELLKADKYLTSTERQQLIQARIGQGRFREAVRKVEPTCRVTGVDDDAFLIASHIKPWSKSDNRERLDGWNGLMLARHVDHLFDSGHITFDDDGCVLWGASVSPAVRTALGLDKVATARPLNQAQAQYMKYHKEAVFVRRQGTLSKAERAVEVG